MGVGTHQRHPDVGALGLAREQAFQRRDGLRPVVVRGPGGRAHSRHFVVRQTAVAGREQIARPPRRVRGTTDLAEKTFRARRAVPRQRLTRQTAPRCGQGALKRVARGGGFESFEFFRAVA